MTKKFDNYYEWLQEYYDLNNELIINEGLIKSYSIESVLDMLKKEAQITNFETSGDISISFPLVKKDKIIKKLDTYGYFISDSVDKASITTALVESKFPAEIPIKFLEKIPHAYHITTNVYLNKIKSIGLKPKESSRKLYNHHGNRIYLLLSDSINVNKDLQNLKNMIIADDKRKEMPPEHNIKDIEYYALKINISELSHKLTFFRDPRLKQDSKITGMGIFTLGNISPDYIENIAKI